MSFWTRTRANFEVKKTDCVRKMEQFASSMASSAWFFLLFITLDQVALQFYSCCPRPVQEQKGLRQPKQGSTAAFCGGLEDWLSCHGWSDLSSGCKTPLFFFELVSYIFTLWYYPFNLGDSMRMEWCCSCRSRCSRWSPPQHDAGDMFDFDELEEKIEKEESEAILVAFWETSQDSLIYTLWLWLT